MLKAILKPTFSVMVAYTRIGLITKSDIVGIFTLQYLISIPKTNESLYQIKERSNLPTIHQIAKFIQFISLPYCCKLSFRSVAFWIMKSKLNASNTGNSVQVV